MSGLHTLGYELGTFQLAHSVTSTSLAFFLDYPHKYGPEGGCADHSVFDRMKRFQASAVEESTVKHSTL